MSRPDDEPPVDLVALRADDELVEDLRASRTPAAVDPVDVEAVAMLTAWRAEIGHDDGPSTDEIVEAFQQQCAQAVARHRWTRISWAIAAVVLALGATALVGDFPRAVEWSLVAIIAVLIAGQQIGWHVVERRERSR